MPPLESQVAVVAVQVARGKALLTGKAVATLDVQLAHVMVTLLPTWRAPLLSTHTYAVPVPAVMVAVADAVILYTVVPTRTRHGALAEQFGPMVRTVEPVRTTARAVYGCGTQSAATVQLLGLLQA